MDLYGITPYLERAEALIKQGDNASMRYAALELRFAHEAVAFRQLRQYGEQFPGKLVGEWKADHILKLLASFDPLSDKGGELSIAPVASIDEEPGEWLSLGSTYSIGWRKFRKSFNTLGSFLHVPTPKTGEEVVEREIHPTAFTSIIEELKRLTQADMILAMKMAVSAECRCGGMVYVGQSDFDNEDQVVCGNRKCNTLYTKGRDAEGVEVLKPVSVVSFTCEKCEARIPVPLEQVWAITRCPGCELEYRLNLIFMSAVPKPSNTQGHAKIETDKVIADRE